MSSSGETNVYDLLDRKRIFSGLFQDSKRAPITQMRFFATSRDYEFLTVGDDCRIDFSVGSGANIFTEWSRHEALSAIASVEIIDLPFSDAQIGIESEFNINGGFLFI